MVKLALGTGRVTAVIAYVHQAFSVRIAHVVQRVLQKNARRTRMAACVQGEARVTNADNVNAMLAGHTGRVMCRHAAVARSALRQAVGTVEVKVHACVENVHVRNITLALIALAGMRLLPRVLYRLLMARFAEDLPVVRVSVEHVLANPAMEGRLVMKAT